jgi:L-amino acid N-acyltransferase YncA
MERETTLLDGTRVLIRPLDMDDVDRSFAFFEALSEGDRTYLRRELSSREDAAERIRAMEPGDIHRLVAIVDDRIVAEAALELERRGWKRNVAELRLIVAGDFQRRGLGLRMARELYSVAMDERVEEIVVKMMRPQVAARSIFRKLGFREETALREWVRDTSGRKHDLILMRCDLKGLWSKLEDYIQNSDFQRSR